MISTQPNNSLLLLILIHVSVLLSQLQQLLKHLQTLRLQVAGIHQLLVVLPPRAHVAFLRDELGGFAVVGFQEVDGFLPFGEPEFGLGHITFIKADKFIALGCPPAPQTQTSYPEHWF